MKSLTVSSSYLVQVAYYLFYPTGVKKIWKRNTRLLVKLMYTIIGFPVFLLSFSYLALVSFAFFLPELDMSVGDRKDRTLFNSAGNYSVTFLKTGADTNGAYELVRVELEPGGGNGWHYHKTFHEHFQVEAGEMMIGLEGEELILTKGEKATALKNQVHFFKNPSSAKATLLVRTEPARGLEKTIRIGYGLANDGLIDENGMANNPWHMALLLGYSESYYGGVPAVIQEPLVKSLAKVAQWKGEDKTLEKYFK
ncbi:cupin domain-containing protein [Pontibacter diazotrophicus]|uniref:Cupin domain-containing protein n=1 Tax=Pontibacter diazotrophicus TaxID=1400979 RepID=A0A3D8LEM5_9BACT|nr:cupin domain-containing protein [Pontibacter diazotrophicus]RDV15909.1 cupin domain-containing protein [Pontibacter diazotrophicus]